MNTIHTKPKWQPYITIVAPGYYGYNRVNTTGVCLYKKYNIIRQERTWVLPSLCQQWPLHTIEEEYPKQSPEII